MRHLLLSAQAWWDTQRFDQSVWQVTYCAETLWHVVIAFSRANANLAAYIHLLWSCSGAAKTCCTPGTWAQYP